MIRARSRASGFDELYTIQAGVWRHMEGAKTLIQTKRNMAASNSATSRGINIRACISYQPKTEQAYGAPFPI